MRTRQQFDGELLALNEMFLAMGRAAGDMVDGAMDALVQGDIALAAQVVDSDDEVDRYNQEIEAECMRLVIQQQPLAHDLRFIGMIFQAVTDIERIADHAVDIAKLALHIAKITRYEPLVDIRLLAGLVREMYNNVLKAFADLDLNLAQSVINADDPVDDLFHEQRFTLLKVMHDDSDRCMLASDLLFVAQFLERIGDRTVNIAERVHQIEKGDRPATH